MKKIFLLCIIIFFAACAREENFREENFFTENFSSEKIRVLIGTCNFEGLFHNSVVVNATGNFFINDDKFRGDEYFHVCTERIKNVGENFFIRTEKPDDKLIIVGLGRGHENPRYYGTFEITRRENGFTIVNELPLEEYLYAVVPSEMPSSYGLEASKVQAITARTFAHQQKRQNNFGAFGANVDDSVISQVYNNIAETEISVEAVRATRGQVLTHNGELIRANFFSTSGGTTANAGEVWAGGENFPSNTPSFLRARAQFFDAIHPGDLRTEEAAAAFFKNRDINAIDKNFPWFRWEIQMTAEEISERVNSVIAERQAANPALIHSLDDFGNPTAEKISTIGRLTDIKITRRGQGGNIMEAIFFGTLANIRVQTEYNIRALLNPREIPVTRHDNSFAKMDSLLPSAFFSMEKNFSNDSLQAIKFFGGGYGHGVGMSQNGVRALLDMGLSYAEILRHYYPGTEISFLN
jgi:stage II sporulation protein D